MAKFELPSPEDDGLYIPTVNPWSADKHHFLMRYIHAFTTAMRTHWDALHYIDLFAGAGIERVKGRDLDWGSPLIAAQSPVPFDRLHLVEKNARKHAALEQRLKQFSPSTSRLTLGDANKCVDDIISQIPSGTLSLAFLDPYGLHLRYETLATLAQRRVDLIIFWPDYMDAVRNANPYYKGNPNSNLTRVLGTDEWEAALGTATRGNEAEVLKDIYVAQIAKLDYKYFEYERIKGLKEHPLYRLIFCSRHKLGADIWRRTAQRKPDGQGSFDFPS